MVGRVFGEYGVAVGCLWGSGRVFGEYGVGGGVGWCCGLVVLVCCGLAVVVVPGLVGFEGFPGVTVEVPGVKAPGKLSTRSGWSGWVPGRVSWPGQAYRLGLIRGEVVVGSVSGVAQTAGPSGLIANTGDPWPDWWGS